MREEYRCTTLTPDRAGEVIHHETVPVDAAVQCVAEDAWGLCGEYTHIRHNGSLAACSYMCLPEMDSSCYRNEWDQEPCLVFDNAPLGRCYDGVCYDNSVYDRLIRLRPPNTRMPCEHGNDYLYNDRGPFGCHFYCREPPNKIARRPDGNVCLNPRMAVQGGCKSGYCVAGYQRS
ncbi:uncharacterized protein LOC135369349 isoform X2 [Ornithodoros turicata]|uniref:uncharacterized protein LOC135369349 isoform X2 n=1 Tax=Ornithodoros turicata TaxID=34597 RepID=UPI003138A5B7